MEMGLFDLFKKKNNDNAFEICSPLDGRIIPLEEIPDEAFASKIIGDGLGLEPTGDTIYAPCDADDISIFDTNHAVSFETKNGLELIVHFGIDTVKLDGKGFERLVEDGQSVKKGDALIKFDLDFIKENAKSHKTPVIISNMDMVEKLERSNGEVKAGDLLIKVRIKI
jgi:glucose-specific phosphotransferase system IIA component